MKKGDLILFKDQYGHKGMFGTILCDPYNKTVWGDSGHPEDIEIASMIKVLMGPKLKGGLDKVRVFRYGQLRRIASVVR